MARRGSIARAVLGVGLGCWMGVSSTVLALAADSVGDEAARATAYAIQLQRSLQAIEDGRQQSARDRWDPQYIVDNVGVDPAALYAWERGSVAWVPYRGQLRGPVGVLMDRRANALDMSLLLAKLLELSGHRVRLAHARLSDAVVDSTWTYLADIAAVADATPDTDIPEEMFAAPTAVPATGGQAMTTVAAEAPTGSAFGDAGTQSGSLFDAAPAEEQPPQTPEEAAALYDLDPDTSNSTLTAVSDVRENAVDQLQARVASQGNRLLSLFEPADGQADYELARAGLALADHWWVQVEQGGNWVDYDLLSPQAAPGTALATAEETVDPNAVPDEDRQRVQIRLVAEQLIGGKLEQRSIVEHEIDPSAVIGKPIKLRNLPMLWPGNWDAVTPDDVQEKLFAALYTQTEWMPMLAIGDESFHAASILDTGVLNPNPDPQSNPFLSLAFPAAGKVGRITDLFGSMLDESAGLGGDDAATPATPPAEGTPRAAGELTSEWIEYTTLIPGEKPKVERRVLFDILGDAMRQSGDFSTFKVGEPQRLARAAGEMTDTEIVILPAWPASEFIADLAAQMALANKPVLDLFAKDPFGKSPPNSVELFSKMSDISGPAFLYSMLRSQSTRTNDTVFIDRPQIVTQHDVLTRVAAGELTSQTALDVVENGVGVDPFSDRDAFMVRLLQGVADTNAETLAMPGVGDSVANAFDAPEDATDLPQWTVLLPADTARIAALGLPPNIAARLKADLDSGQAAVLPPTAADVAKHGWWRVDPGTGTTLGIGNLGWGQDLVEYAFKLTIQLMMAQLGCMAFQAAAEPKVRGLTAEEGRDKIQQWFKGCVSQALLETVAGISTSWIHSRFLEGSKMRRWDKRAETSKTRPFTLPPQATPHGPTGEEGPHTSPRTTPPHEDTPPTPPVRTTPPHDDAPPTTRPPTTPPTEDGNTGPRTRPPTEEGGNNGPRPPTDEGGNTGTRKTPPVEPEDRLKPLPPDESLDGKTMLDPNCMATGYEVRVALLEVDPPAVRSDAEPAPLLVAACPTPKPRDPSVTPRPEDQPEVAKKVQSATDEAKAARQAEIDAAKKYYDDPSPENEKAYRDAEQASRAKSDAEEEQWWQNKGKGLPPGSADREPLPPPPEGWDPKNPRGGPTPTGEPEGGASPANASPNPGPPPEPEGGPSNPPRPPVEGEGGPPNSRPPVEGEGGSPNSAKPPAGDDGGAAPKTGPQPEEGSPLNKTQQMEDAPKRPPQTDAERVEAIRDATDARIEAQRRETAAEDAFDKNPSTANRTELENALDASNKAHMDEIEAWVKSGGKGFPPTKEAQLSPGRPDAAPGPAPIAPDEGGVPRTGPAPQTGPQQPIEQGGPATPRPPAEQEGPATPRPPAEEELGSAKTQQAEPLPPPNKTQPLDGAPPRPPAEDLGNAKTQQAEPGPAPLNQTQPMEGAPRPVDPALADTQSATPTRPTADEGATASPKPPPLDLAGAQQNYDAALDAFRADPSAANKAALTDALHGLDRAEAANPRPQPAPPVEPSAELSSAKQAYDDALAAYRQDRSADNAAALDKALGDYNRATNQARTGQPEPAPASPNASPPPAAEPDGPPTPRPQGEPEAAPNPRPTAEQEGAPRPVDPALADTQSATPTRPTTDEGATASPKPAPLDLAGAQQNYDAALDAFRADPSAANKAALTDALHGLDRAEAANPRPQPAPPVEPSAELSSAKQAYDDALAAYRQDRSADNAAALDKALGDYNRATNQARTGQPGPVKPEVSPTPRPVQADPAASPNAQSVAVNRPAPVEPVEGPQEIRPITPEAEGPRTPAAAGTPGGGPEAIRAARDEFMAAQQRAAEADAALAKNPTPEAVANRDLAQQASADAAKAERDAWAAATPAQRAEAYKPFEDARIAAQQRSDDAERAYDMAKTPEALEAYRQADAALVEARRAELAAQLRSGISGRKSAPPQPAAAEPAPATPEAEGPPTPRPPADGGASPPASPNAQSVVINRPSPVARPEGPQEVRPLAPEPPANGTQPVEEALAPRPQTTEQRAASIATYTDAAVATHNAEVDAARAVMASDTPANRAAYDQAQAAAERARVAESAQWFRVGGPGAPPSRTSGAMQPIPDGLYESLKQGNPALDATVAADAAGGTNSTLAMGLGSLAGTIQRGP